MSHVDLDVSRRRQAPAFGRPAGTRFRLVTPSTSVWLDRIRATAAGLVVLGHARSIIFPDWVSVPLRSRKFLLGAFYFFTGFGHEAVIVFFVLSGFLVGGNAIREAAGRSLDLRRYFAARVSRIYSVLLPALLVGAVWDTVGLHYFGQGGVYSGHIFTGVLSVSVATRLNFSTLVGNSLCLQGIAYPTFGSNGPLWSLTNEFWYYVLWPLILIPVFGGYSNVQRAAAAATAVIVGWLLYPSVLAYGLLWGLGVLARSLPRPMLRSGVVSVALGLGALGASRVSHLRAPVSASPAVWEFGVDVVVAVAFSLLLNWLNCSGPGRSTSGNRVSAAFAGFSYSLYAAHLPFAILCCAAAREIVGIQLPRRAGDGKAFAIYVGLVILAYGYCWLVSLVTERRTSAVRAALLSEVKWPRWGGPLLVGDKR